MPVPHCLGVCNQQLELVIMLLYRVFWFLCVVAVTFGGDPMENDDLYEGDIELTKEDKLEMFLTDMGVPTFGATSRKNNWPKLIYYRIHKDLEKEKRAVKAIKEAIRDFDKHTCIKLRKLRSKRKKYYLYFIPGTGCSSPLGFKKRVNNIKLASGCWSKGIVMHEILHSLGFAHEQSRPDRDKYVRIRWENVPKKKKHNFKKTKYAHWNSYGSRYDYGSIMHYRATAFGSGKVTIESRRRGGRTKMGQRKGFSKSDIYQIRKKYKC